MNLSISFENKKNIILAARKAVETELFKKTSFFPDLTDSFFDNKSGIFVTIHKSGKLRGCIGYIEGFMPIREAIYDLALSAAFRDPRFPPLSSEEYKHIDFEISILSPIKQINSIDEINVGEDGLIITKGMKRGLLLPQVATENNMTKDEFLSHTCMKAGLSPNEWKSSEVQIEKFSAVIIKENELES